MEESGEAGSKRKKCDDENNDDENLEDEDPPSTSRISDDEDASMRSMEMSADVSVVMEGDTCLPTRRASQSHWTEAAETQLAELITLYKAQGYSGPILWELVASKCDYNFTADQCMSKWYREKTKQRYRMYGKKKRDGPKSMKWTEEGTSRLNASVELIKSQDFEGTKLWNLVAESLDGKWTPTQCMNKYYRDRHKIQKTKK